MNLQHPVKKVPTTFIPIGNIQLHLHLKHQNTIEILHPVATSFSQYIHVDNHFKLLTIIIFSLLDHSWLNHSSVSNFHFSLFTFHRHVSSFKVSTLYITTDEEEYDTLHGLVEIKLDAKNCQYWCHSTQKQWNCDFDAHLAFIISY